MDRLPPTRSREGNTQNRVAVLLLSLNGTVIFIVHCGSLIGIYCGPVQTRTEVTITIVPISNLPVLMSAVLSAAMMNNGRYHLAVLLLTVCLFCFHNWMAEGTTCGMF